MSYLLSRALQEAVFARLTGDAGLMALTGGAIHDTVPPGPRAGLSVSLGPETVEDRSDATGRGAFHLFTVTVLTDEGGFAAAKDAAAAAVAALDDAPLTLSRGRLVFLRFDRAMAERNGRTRQIDLRFRARVEDDQP